MTIGCQNVGRGLYSNHAELRRGQKTGPWIRYNFPQVAGLGHSDVLRFYAIASLDEAHA
jgi:uncharacterized protein (DUF1810 family)